MNKTWYISDSGNVVVDPENGAKAIPTSYEAISRLYLVPDDMHLIYNCGEDKKETDVHKNDIVVVFYNKTFKNRMIVVNSAEWAENIIDYNERQQKEKEDWAAKKVAENFAKTE